MAQVRDPIDRDVGSPSNPRATLQQRRPQAMLGDFRILREVGRGGMGIVYEAEQVSLGRRVALKVLPPAMALDPLRIQRFRVETQAVASLNHPSIVPIYAVGHAMDTPFFAMRFIDGRTLAEMIRESRSTCEREATPDGSNRPASDDRFAGPIEQCTVPDDRGPSTEVAPFIPSREDPTHRDAPSQASFDHRAIAEFGFQAAEALAHVHGLGILHRDIKPANLLVDTGGRLWVTDFGMARLQGESDLTRTGDLIGTLRYMSPEQALGRRELIDPRTDVYSLGATLYELLALCPAFESEDRQELLRKITEESPRPLRAIDPAIPADLETLVHKAMSREPAGRYPTAEALADDLKRFLSGDPILARPVGPAERIRRWCLRPQRVREAGHALLTLGFLTSGIGAFWYVGYLIGILRPRRPVDFQLDLLIAFIVFDAPPIWCGMKTLAGRRSGLRLGLLTSLNFLFWLLVGLSGREVFDYGGIFEDKNSDSPFVLLLLLLVAYTAVRVAIGLAAQGANRRGRGSAVAPSS
jgi:serine/threonine protein kinase